MLGRYGDWYPVYIAQSASYSWRRPIPCDTLFDHHLISESWFGCSTILMWGASEDSFGVAEEDLAMSEEQAFLLAIRQHPEDESTRLVYADWLEERGDYRGEYLRVQIALLKAARQGKQIAGLVERYRVLRPQLDTEWIESTSWPTAQRKSSVLCLLRHRWERCLCARCGAVANDTRRHVWVGCQCALCGTIRTVPTPDHLWRGCRCCQCGRSRDSEHDWVGCKCRRCLSERHKWQEGICKTCGEICHHPSTSGSSEDYLWDSQSVITVDRTTCIRCGLVLEETSTKYG
jgi:uncharacterized protein (TIGR02996 family)